MDEDSLARVALSMQHEPGLHSLSEDIHCYGAAAVLAGRPERTMWMDRAAELVRRCRSSGVAVLTPGDPQWPTQVDDLPVPPIVLYARGMPLRPAALRSVSVVGSRAATPAGTQIAEQWSAELAAGGFAVVSGAAFGIDAAAHRGALRAGATIAVLAAGVDVASPRGNQSLLAQIAKHGTIVSELPPGTHPMPSRFIARNRVIAALAPATLVVQAATRSGALATARQAAALNRIVMAVPGSVLSPSHAGCHGLIRDQLAVLVADVPQVLQLLLPFYEQAMPPGQGIGSSTAR